MNTMRLAVIAIGLAVSARAGSEVSTLAAETLGDWTLSGATQEKVLDGAEVVLPASAQLSRAFSASALRIHLVSKPVVGLTPAAWPILEMGPVALVLTREQGSPSLAPLLVLGDADPVPLPVAVAAGEGTSVDLARNPGRVSVTIEGRSFEFPYPETSHLNEQRVALSNGAQGAWRIEELKVELVAADPTGSEGVDRAGDAAETGQDRTPSARRAAIAGVGESKSKPGSGVDADSATEKDGSRRAAVEILTPPAVSRGRTFNLRERLAQRAKQQAEEAP